MGGMGISNSGYRENNKKWVGIELNHKKMTCAGKYTFIW